MAEWLARNTKTVRHALCKRLAPTLFAGWSRSRAIIGGVPRPMTLFLKDYMGDRALTGCEIGVARGHNAKNICETLNIKTLYLIDPYTQYCQSDILIHGHTSQLDTAQQVLADFTKQINWLVCNSSEALPCLPKTLDFAYIDGNHQYQFVKQDLRLYFERVRHGGVLGGHDLSGDHAGVIRAVVEFAIEKELDLHAEGHDFWFVKP